jgi:hypothetical protein
MVRKEENEIILLAVELTYRRRYGELREPLTIRGQVVQRIILPHEKGRRRRTPRGAKDLDEAIAR